MLLQSYLLPSPFLLYLEMGSWLVAQGSLELAASALASSFSVAEVAGLRY